MASRSQYAANRGFAIIEVVIAFALVTAILSIGLPASWDFYRSYEFDSDITTFVAALEQARNASLNNLNQSAHGVYVSSTTYVVFQGSSYAARTAAYDKNFPRNNIITVTGPSEILFSALAGQPASSTYLFTSNQRSINISINNEGGIIY